jgi:hypothetical protein
MLVRRLVLISIGLILAVAAGFMFLLIAGLAQPASRKVLEGLGWLFLAAARSDAMQGDPPGSYLVLAARIMWWAMLAIVVAPIVITALVGEAARLRSFLWNVGAPAIMTAAIPWVARSARSPGSAAIRDAATRSAETQVDQVRLLLLLFLCGAVSGFIYWAVSGREAGLFAPSAAALNTPPSPKS